MLGLLPARAGVRVTGLEKHEDFLHGFRGDTVHPATQCVGFRPERAPAFARRPPAGGSVSHQHPETFSRDGGTSAS